MVAYHLAPHLPSFQYGNMSTIMILSTVMVSMDYLGMLVPFGCFKLVPLRVHYNVNTLNPPPELLSSPFTRGSFSVIAEATEFRFESFVFCVCL